jgi:NDP-sugar pyrophosphorylase family protein
VGNPQQYFQSVRDIQSGKLQLETLPLIDPSVEIGAESILTGANQIGKNVKIGQNCEIDNCIIWNDVNIGDNAKLVNCIIGSNGFVNAGAKLKDQILVAANNGAKA